MYNKKYAVTTNGIERPRGVQFNIQFEGGRTSEELCFFVILMVLIISSILISCACAITITVCDRGCDNTSIKSALDCSRPGDVIEIHGGTYEENLNIHKKVSLIGIPDENGMPVIDGGGHGSVITISADGVNITGFNLRNSGKCGCGDSGVRIRSNNDTVYGNNITGNHYGAYAQKDSKGSMIFGNNITGNKVNARDSGDNQWYGVAQSSSDTLRIILGYFGLKKPSYVGNHYDDYDGAKEGCIAENNICKLPYNITGKENSTNQDPYPQVSLRI